MPKKEYPPPTFEYALFINGRTYDFAEMTEEQRDAAHTAVVLRFENARLKGTGIRATADIPDMNTLFPGDVPTE